MKKIIGRILIIVTALAIVFCIISSVISDTDWYQLKTSPKQYWTKQVETLEKAIKHDMVMIRDAEIELTKVRVTAPLETIQMINLAEGNDVNEKIWQEWAELKIDIAKDYLKLRKEARVKDQNDLEKARAELAKYE